MGVDKLSKNNFSKIFKKWKMEVIYLYYTKKNCSRSSSKKIFSKKKNLKTNSGISPIKIFYFPKISPGKKSWSKPAMYTFLPLVPVPLFHCIPKRSAWNFSTESSTCSLLHWEYHLKGNDWSKRMMLEKQNFWPSQYM